MSSFSLLWSDVKNIFFNFPYLLLIILCPYFPVFDEISFFFCICMWSILETVLWNTEKNVLSLVFEWIFCRCLLYTFDLWCHLTPNFIYLGLTKSSDYLKLWYWSHYHCVGMICGLKYRSVFFMNLDALCLVHISRMVIYSLLFCFYSFFLDFFWLLFWNCLFPVTSRPYVHFCL